MGQMALVQQDLVLYIGSKSKVSEVLAGKRRLTLSMIRALEGGLGIPARVLVQDSRPEEVLPGAIDWRRFPVREMAIRGYFGALGSGKCPATLPKLLLEIFLPPSGQEWAPCLLSSHGTFAQTAQWNVMGWRRGPPRSCGERCAANLPTNTKQVRSMTPSCAKWLS